MVFDRLKGAADQVKEAAGQAGAAAGELGGAAFASIGHAQKELNEALPVLLALGLSVRMFEVDMTVPPVVQLTLVGAVAAIQPDKLKGVIDSHKDKKVLVMILEALRTAAFMKDQLGDLGLRGVTADVTLALPPSVKVAFMKDPPALTA